MVEKVSMEKKVEALAEAFKFKEHFSSKIIYIRTTFTMQFISFDKITRVSCNE